ncbi:MAG: ChrR family anti-sigma-E factor [Gammaproteobacteria bacterium]|jgi:putative transcriptional regulator
MVHYHPTDEHLMQFSAGQMADALGIIIACHLEQCSQCRHHAAMFEELGGEILRTTDPTPLGEGVLDRLLARLDEPVTAGQPRAQGVGTSDPRIPRPLRRFVPCYFDGLNWSGMTRSIKEYRLPISDDRYTAKFYKIAAGSELPEHTHKGNEFTLVMQGSFSDHEDEYHPGDFILADTHKTHRPHASEECDCICFAVLDAPLKLTGFLGKLVNPFLR